MSSTKAIKGNGTFKAERRGKLVFVSVLPKQIKKIKDFNPHTGIKCEQIIFTFRHDNGELVDYEPSNLLSSADGLIIKQLAVDARMFARQSKLIEPVS